MTFVLPLNSWFYLLFNVIVMLICWPLTIYRHSLATEVQVLIFNATLLLTVWDHFVIIFFEVFWSIKTLFQFLRLSWDTHPSMVYILMTTHWGLLAPNLVVSVVGGEGRTKLKTWVREVIRQGLVKASQSTGEHTAVAYHFSNSLAISRKAEFKFWAFVCKYSKQLK